MDQNLWKKAVDFHGHECPGLAIGFKACEALQEKMEAKFSQDEEIVCVTENDACGVDAVQVITGCTFGKGNLLYKGTGKMAFSFFNRTSGKSLRIMLKPLAWEGSQQELQNYILNASSDELFKFTEPTFQLPEKAIIFKTVICEKCGEGAPEHKVRINNEQKVCLDCFQEYSRGW